MKNIIFILIICGFFFPLTAKSQRKLLKACYKDDYVTAQEEIEKGTVLNSHDIMNCTPLMVAVLNRNKAIVELLLKSGAKSDTCPTKHSKHYLMQNPIYLRTLFDDKKILFDPLYYAIHFHQIDIVKLFCDYGYNVNKRIGGNIFTYPITAAALVKDTAIFNLIFEKGVDIGVRDVAGNNALMYWIEANNLEMSKRLVQKGCPLNDTSNLGYTPLMYAAAVHEVNAGIPDLLISHNVDLKYVNSKNESALSLACLYNNRELAFLLMDQGVKITETDVMSNARMYHLTGDYYLIKEDLKNSKENYNKAKQWYKFCITLTEAEILKINRKRAFEAMLSVAVATGQVYVGQQYANQYTINSYQNVGMNLNESQTNTMAALYTDNYQKTFYDYRLSDEASLNEKKIFHKNKIKQFETAISSIEGILDCIEKGLTGQDLNSCILANPVFKQ